MIATPHSTRQTGITNAVTGPEGATAAVSTAPTRNRGIRIATRPHSPCSEAASASLIFARGEAGKFGTSDRNTSLSTSSNSARNSAGERLLSNAC